MFYECFKNEGFLYIMHCRPKKYICVCVLIWLPIHTKCKRFLPLWVIDLFEWIRSRNNLNKIYKYGYVQWVHHCCSLLFTKISIIYPKKGYFPFSLLILYPLSLSRVCAHTHKLETKISIKGPMALCDTFCRLAVL